MSARASWCKRIGGLLAVLLLAVLVIGPTAEGYLCADDDAPPRHLAGFMFEAPHPDAGHTAGPHIPGACLHGHVHFSAPTLTDAGATSDTCGYRPQTYALADLIDPAWRAPGGLDRPPRA